MKGKFVLALLPAVLFYISSCQKHSGDVSLKNEHDSVSYIIGYNIGTNIVSSPMTEPNIQAIAKGIEDAMAGKKLFTDQYSANSYIGTYMQKMESASREKNLMEGRAFLEKNKARKGVTTTESGLQYEVLVEGNGPRPKETDTVTVHYKGTLIDGTEFESSVDGEPATFSLNQVIPAWTEALKLMPVGSKWKIYVPTELAYGVNPRPGGKIKPNMALIFEIELLAIK